MGKARTSDGRGRTQHGARGDREEIEGGHRKVGSGGYTPLEFGTCCRGRHSHAQDTFGRAHTNDNLTGRCSRNRGRMLGCSRGNDALSHGNWRRRRSRGSWMAADDTLRACGMVDGSPWSRGRGRDCLRRTYVDWMRQARCRRSSKPIRILEISSRGRCSCCRCRARTHCGH